LRFSVFPRPRKSREFHGVLGLYLEIGNTVVGVNCASGIVELFKSSLSSGEELSRYLVLSSANPANLGGIEELADMLKDSGQNIALCAPRLLDGWLKALMMETDYSSERLKELSFTTYDASKETCLASSPPVNIEYCPDDNGFFDYLLKFTFEGLNISLFYGEAVDLTKKFPEFVYGADVLIANISKYPAIPRNSDSVDITEELISIFADNKIKSSVIPGKEGILLGLPASKPEYRKWEQDLCELDLGPAKAKIIHEKDFEHYRNSIFPALVQDDEEHDSILLGMGLGAALHKRAENSGKFDFSTMLMTDCSYKKVFSCIDLLDQLERGRRIEVICGKAMSEAINYFSVILQNSYRREMPSFIVSASEENKTTQHIMFNSLEVLMIPYPKKDDAYIARIRDLKTDEYLIFTETVENLFFLGKNLKGVHTLVAALDIKVPEERGEISEKLKAMQEKNSVQRLVILYPGSTIMSDLDI